MATMRIARLVKPRQFELMTAARPEPREGEVLIKVIACGVCKGDFDTWDGRSDAYPLDPGSPGHEVYGKVEALGANVSTVRVGDTVTAITFPGYGYAEYVTAHHLHVARLRDSSERAMVIGEPLACAVNAARKSNILPGDSVLLIGVGFMGALILKVIRSMGAAPIIATDLSEFNRDLARRNGADVVVEPGAPCLEAVRQATQGTGVDVVIEATGMQSALDIATDAIRIKGTIVIYGYHSDGLRQINMQKWNYKALRVVNGHERDSLVYAEGMRKGITLIEHGRIVYDVITHEFSLDAINDGFSVIKQRPRGYIKAVIKP
jgi:threonine dehydrogenase-like Zn-dependent dehydrogenase